MADSPKCVFVTAAADGHSGDSDLVCNTQHFEYVFLACNTLCMFIWNFYQET